MLPPTPLPPTPPPPTVFLPPGLFLFDGGAECPPDLIVDAGDDGFLAAPWPSLDAVRCLCMSSGGRRVVDVVAVAPLPHPRLLNGCSQLLLRWDPYGGEQQYKDLILCLTEVGTGAALGGGPPRSAAADPFRVAGLPGVSISTATHGPPSAGRVQRRGGALALYGSAPLVLIADAVPGGTVVAQLPSRALVPLRPSSL